MTHHVQEVPGQPGEICPLLIGAKVPDLTLKKVDGSPFNLSDAISRKRAVLIFYRGGW